MGRGTTPWWRSRGAAATGIVLLAALALGAFLVIDEAGRSDGDGAEWTRVGAVVLAYRGPDGDRDPTGVVSVAYRAGSSEMRADVETRYEGFGPTVDVEYDPADPRQVRVAGERRRTGDLVVTVLGAVVVGAGVAAIIVAQRSASRWARQRLPWSAGSGT